MVKLLVNDEEIPFEITKFPDGTSQVWKLAKLPVAAFGGWENDDVKILWLFEKEAELFHVCQLATLLQKECNATVDLKCPFLPYGRQDKEVTNNSTFALNVFREILYNVGICRIESFDAHSKTDMIYEQDTVTVRHFHKYLADLNLPFVICYPDAGAAKRYKYSFNIDEFEHIYFEKVRNQLTGEITGLKLVGTSNLEGRHILIVDDICDGGMTFIKVAEALKQYNPKQIDLAVSHGLFSKGKQPLLDAGISNIYTTNSLLRNPEGFKVW